jgi:hypothetical protein
MSGSPDWGGTSLVHGIDVLANGFGVAVGPGQLVAFPPFSINRPGYLCNLEAEYSGASGTTPLVTADFGWYDQGQNVHFGHEEWTLPVGTAGNGFFHTGRGPTKGQLFQLSFQNFDAAQSIQATFWFAQTTQHASRDDIRLHADGVSPVWTIIGGDDPTKNILADFVGLAVPPAGAGPFLLPLYSGQASLYWTAVNQSAANNVSLEIIPANTSGTHADVYLAFAGASPFRSAPGALITLPRRVCMVKFANSGAATATVTMTLIAQEYSS